MIVIDASALVEMILGGMRATAVTRRVSEPGVTMNAPHLIEVESLQAIRRQSWRGGVGASRAQAAFQLLLRARLTLYPHTPLLGRIWSLRQNVTAYDATYIALAESLGAPLLTCDRRLASSAGHNATIEVF